MNFEVIKANDKDTLSQSLEVRRLVFTVEKGISQEDEVDAFDVLDNVCDHFLVRYNGENVGAFRCMHKLENIVQLQRFCFLNSYRCLGLGRKALDFAEKYYRKNNIKKIILDSQYPVKDFYEKCGYQTVSDIFMEVNIPHVKMEKII